MTNAAIRSDAKILRVSRIGNDMRITGTVDHINAESPVQPFGRPSLFCVTDLDASIVRAMPIERTDDSEDAANVDMLLRNRSSRLTVAIEDIIRF